MKIYSWLVWALLVVHALTYSQHDASFLGVHDALGLREDPIVATPQGLPPEVHRSAEWQHPGRPQKTVRNKVDRIEELKDHSPSGHSSGQHHEDRRSKEVPRGMHHSPWAPLVRNRKKTAHHEETFKYKEPARAGEHSSHHEQHADENTSHLPSAGEGAEHEASETESLSLACLLMGGVGAFMVVFHFANSPHLDIQLSAWRVLNMTVSIFAAVLLYGILKEIIILVFQPGVTTLIFITLILFVVLFVGSHAFLYKLKTGDEVQVRASGVILAHICGFAGMYGLADSREIKLIEEYGTAGMVVLILFSGVFIACLIYIMDLVMKKVEDDDSVVDTRDEEGRTPRDQDELWIETCEEMDDDVFCLATSFSIVLWFRYLIRGHPMPYVPGEVGNVTQRDANYLLACSLFFAVLVFAGAYVMFRFKFWIHHTWHSSLLRRILSNAQHLNSMIMAWSFLFWAEWQLYVWGWEHTIIGGCLAIAIFLTLFSFGCVVLLNYIKGHFRHTKVLKRSMASLELALGVLVGFSWERAFDVGFEEIDAKYRDGIFGPSLVILLSLALFAIVAPAWRLNILPKVLKLERKAKKREELAQQEKETSAQ